MQFINIELPEFTQILARNSITQSNFLQENEYLEKPRKIVSNKDYIVWIFEECLDLNIFKQKLQNTNLIKNMKQIYRSELRYLITNQDNNMQDIEYHEKYKTFQLGCTLQNAKIDQFDISQNHLVALTTDGVLIVINMQQNHHASQQAKPQQQSSSSLSPQKKQTFDTEQDQLFKINLQNNYFVRIIMAENQSDFFYALDNQNNFYQISFLSTKISNIINIVNYDSYIGNHDGQRIRIIEINRDGYLLYSLQNYLFYLEIQNTTNEKSKAIIKKSHYMKDISFSLILSSFQSNIFMINNQYSSRYYLLFVENIIEAESQQIFNSITKYIYSFQASPDKGNTQTASKIHEFIQQFTTQKTLFKDIKKAWSLKICKLLQQMDKDYYHQLFNNYILYQLQKYLTQHQLNILDLIQISVILLLQLKPKYLITLLYQLESIIVDNKIKNEIWQKVWDFMPLYDLEREQKDPDYKCEYIKVCNMLGTENQIKFLLTEN
ncbi:hypothetical protein ABPG72_007674 [Tetrahymena utriculariae]